MGERRLAISMVFHSLLRSLLISPVRIIWFSADTCGRRLRAKIMKAFMGLFGVPSELRVCAVSLASSAARCENAKIKLSDESLTWRFMR